MTSGVGTAPANQQAGDDDEQEQADAGPDDHPCRQWLADDAAHFGGGGLGQEHDDESYRCASSIIASRADRRHGVARRR